jgi:hypothetical protein
MVKKNKTDHDLVAEELDATLKQLGLSKKKAVKKKSVKKKTNGKSKPKKSKS